MVTQHRGQSHPASSVFVFQNRYLTQFAILTNSHNSIDFSIQKYILGTACKSGVIRFKRLPQLTLWMVVVGFGNLQSCSDSYPKIILLPLVSLIRHQYNILLGLTQQIGSGVNGQLLWNSAWQFCFCETLDPRSCSFCPEDQILKIFVALMRWQCPNLTSVTQDLIKM